MVYEDVKGEPSTKKICYFRNNYIEDCPFQNTVYCKQYITPTFFIVWSLQERVCVKTAVVAYFFSIICGLRTVFQAAFYLGKEWMEPTCVGLGVYIVSLVWPACMRLQKWVFKVAGWLFPYLVWCENRLLKILFLADWNKILFFLEQNVCDTRRKQALVHTSTVTCLVAEAFHWNKIWKQ